MSFYIWADARIRLINSSKNIDLKACSASFPPEHRVSHSWSPPWDLFKVCWKSAVTAACDLILVEADDKCQFLVSKRKGQWWSKIKGKKISGSKKVKKLNAEVLKERTWMLIILGVQRKIENKILNSPFTYYEEGEFGKWQYLRKKKKERILQQNGNNSKNAAIFNMKMK